MKEYKNINKIIDKILEDSKAIDVIKINLSKKSSLCDYFYITNGTSSRHVKSIADHIVKAFKELGMHSVSTEGDNANNWIVIDLGSVVIHIFQKEAREKYRLEDIWKS